MKQIIDTILCADARGKLFEIPNDYVHLIVTSPPYWNARRYCFFNNKEIGQTCYKTYLHDLWFVFKRCSEILKPDGKMVIVIGEINLKEDPKEVVTYSHIFTGIFKIMESIPKMSFFGKILWCKGTTNDNAGYRKTKAIFGSYPYPPNMLVTNATENILIFRKKGRRARPRDSHILKFSKLDKSFAHEFTRPIWFISPIGKKQHPAVFPEEIPKRFIKAFTFIGDVVMDPFAGIGTTLKAAKDLGRHYLGIELSSKYVKIAKEVLK